MINPLPLWLFMTALSGYSTATPTGCVTSTEVVQRASADIIFLLDGSGSVAADQFLIMKTFVKNVTRSLLPYNVSFAFAQYSSSFTTHVNFKQFNTTTFESQVNGIVQSRGSTYTAWAMGRALQDTFDSSVGARAGAKRFLIVITDGRSSDSASYHSVAAQADASNITRYAIGVGAAWSSQSSQNELRAIGSKPESEHVFKVTDFGGLKQIRKSLEEKILTIQGVIGNCPNQGNQTCPPASSNPVTTTQAADIVFLLDGSSSVKADQFILMKTFVKNVTRSLLQYNTLFAFAQYSDQMTKHVNFNEFNRTGFGNQVDSIVQRQGGTHTGYAVFQVVKYVFHAFAGARPAAKRILILITDGLTHDGSRYPSVTAEADKENITRYAIGVGSTWSSQTAQDQLRAIASKPESDHVFEVDSFDALGNISKALGNKVMVFETRVVPTVNGNAEGAPCVFPFVYLGTVHRKCTTINHDKRWCSTTSNFDEDELWGECCIQDEE
ncbi:cartilage matrix protein-like [Sardina pilchardus]|uniref:cartilage matrix protein-like n=1 Tax=Sardina pilchardus TaxID=27697 RepID=UPI002E0E4FA8